MGRVTKGFTLFVAVAPVISMYATLIPGVNMAEMILIVFGEFTP